MGRVSSGKNARKVVQDCIIYCPQEFEAQGRDAVRRIFTGAVAAMNGILGEENFIDCDVHFDEQHAYLDPLKREIVTSRIHGHATHVMAVDYGIVEKKEKVFETDDDGNKKFDENGDPIPVRGAGGRIKWKKVGEERVEYDTPHLNGNLFSSPGRIRATTKAVDEFCQREFGIKYVLGTGKVGKKSLSVEEKKLQSYIATVEGQQVAELAAEQARQERDYALSLAQEFERQANESRFELKAKQKELDSLREAVNKGRDELVDVAEEVRQH